MLQFTTATVQMVYVRIFIGNGQWILLATLKNDISYQLKIENLIIY